MLDKQTRDYHNINYPVISVSVGRAKPKSRILSSQSSLTAMLEGFKSLQKKNIKDSKSTYLYLDNLLN